MFGVLKRQLQHQAEAALPHSTIPLSRLAGEGDKADKGTSLMPIAWSEFTNRVYSCLPYTQEDYLCADENS